PVLDPALSSDELSRRQLGEGIGAVPGAACGEIVFSAERAELRAKEGASVILVRKETSPEDVGGMHAAVGILTATGGKTSHAAVVARGWGKCCIVGCEILNIDYGDGRMSLNGRSYRQGDWITLDGTTGRIYDGRIQLVRPEAPAEYGTIMEWCDAMRRLRVRANADTPADAAKAVELGAEGIGLCRTEHMFFDSSQPQRIRAMREMIVAADEDARRTALEKLLPYQVEDFEGIFKAMNGRPVTVRLLDPPLHEFLPQRDNPSGVQAVVDELNAGVRDQISKLSLWDADARRRLETKLVTPEDIHRRVDQLHEANPMLGHRGCRLCITYPEILDMQVCAIIEAAVRCTKGGVPVRPEIMIPLSIDPKELAMLIARTRAVADKIIAGHGVKLPYLVGTMIETPRAALLADGMARSAEFFSFGTNDLTQLSMGLSRDDAGKFLPDYLDESLELCDGAASGEPRASARADQRRAKDPRASTRGVDAAALRGPIFAHDPFQSLDVDGVGALVRMSCEKGRGVRSDLKLGICGEHGGDPKSIRLCEAVGLDYVSCSPLRVPIARLAAAQAAVEAGFRAPMPGARPKTSKRKASSTSARKSPRASKPGRERSQSRSRTARTQTKRAKAGGGKKSRKRGRSRSITRELVLV
ncbi:MAG: putative PEP-binding protein, partial [Planctomycetota bacterium]